MLIRKVKGFKSLPPDADAKKLSGSAGKKLMQFGAQKIAHSYLIRHDKINCPKIQLSSEFTARADNVTESTRLGGWKKMVAKKDARQQWNYIFGELFRML